MTIKIGILGCGRMGERHTNACHMIPDAEVVGFADIDIERAEILAKKFGKKTYSVNELLDDRSVDAIHICTPNQSHAEHAIAALESGKHTLVEKPMAMNLADCDKMIRISKMNDVNLMIGHTYRYYPSSLKAKEIIDSNEIGKIKLILDYGLDPGQLPGKAKTPDWAMKKETGGGVFVDAIHGIDKLRYWLNSEVKSVYVPIMDKINDSYSIEQMGFAILTFENDAVATLMPVAPTWGIRDTGCKIIGKKGALYVTYGEEVKVGRESWKEYSFDYQNKPASYEHNLQGFVNEISEFINSIREKRMPAITGEEGKKNLRIVLAMYESFEKKRIIEINN